MIDKVLSTYFKLYYYVDPIHTPIYALFYDVIVYPAFAIVYSRWFPVKRKLINLALYNLAWAVFMTSLELAYIFPTRIIVYLDWHIVPDSILFYVIGFPFYCCYYLLIEKWLKNVSHE